MSGHESDGPLWTSGHVSAGLVWASVKVDDCCNHFLQVHQLVLNR
jgi:hypothetical protein